MSYGTGHRPGDGPGCGPGMLYCRQVAEMLNERGIATFSGELMSHILTATQSHALPVLFILLTPIVLFVQAFT